MKKYITIGLILLLVSACEKDENNRRESQRKVVFTADPLNGKIAFETIDDPKNVIKDEAWLNTGEPKQGLEGFVEKDSRFLDQKRSRYKVVGVIK